MKNPNAVGHAILGMLAMNVPNIGSGWNERVIGMEVG